MKIQCKLLFSFMAATIFFLSCSDNDTAVELNDEEVIEIIQAMTFSGERGLLEQMTGGDKNNDFDFSDFCNVPFSETFQGDYNRKDIVASYSSKVSIEASCVELPGNFILPELITFDVSTEADYNRPVIDADYTSMMSGTITEILSLNPLLINYDFSASGNQLLTVREERNAVSTLTFQITDLAIDKSSFEIVSGTGAFTLAGTVNDIPFSYIGTITVNGDNTATIEWNGESYLIDWNF